MQTAVDSERGVEREAKCVKYLKAAGVRRLVSPVVGLLSELEAQLLGEAPGLGDTLEVPR